MSSPQKQQQRPVNAVQQRLVGLNLLERAVKALSDDELDALVLQLTEEQKEALAKRAGSLESTSVREQLGRGRMNGMLEGISSLLADRCLTDCIEVLGESSDNPTEDELQGVLPGLVERHGVGVVRVMMTTAIVGEALATPILKDLLKTDALVALPPAEFVSITVPKPVDPDRDAKLALRKVRKDAEKVARAKRR